MPQLNYPTYAEIYRMAIKENKTCTFTLIGVVKWTKHQYIYYTASTEDPGCLFAVLSFVIPILGAGKFSGNCEIESITFARRPLVRLSLEYQPTAEVIQAHASPSECFSKCFHNSQCYGYFLNYQNNSCVTVLKSALSNKYFVPSEKSSYHWKICLDAKLKGVESDKCASHEWAYDVFPDVQLSRYDDKVVSNTSFIEQCMELCSAENTFVCRSSSFKSETKECVLSRHDRRTAPDAFRKTLKTKEAVIYMERQCINEPSGCLFGAKKLRYPYSSRQHVQVMEGIASREQCEQTCMKWEPFPCRSYQFVLQQDACIISPEDSNRIGTQPQATGPSDHSFNIFEKESCVESSVRCGPTSMSVIVKVVTPFRGRLYALGYPYDCYSVTVSAEGELTLVLPLHGRRCGTRNLGNGTFLNSVVVQHHPYVLRTSDRRIEVACDYQELNRVKIKGTKDVHYIDMNDGDFQHISQHTVTAVAPTPSIRLRVVNASDQDVAGAELGDPLFLKVELADESVYGIFGSGLVARSSAGAENVLLINDNGCPVEPSVISSLEKLPGSKSLVAPFQAFKFASDAAVKFQLTVSYCLDACPPVDCELASSKKNLHQSYGRRKKRAAAGMFTELHSGDVILDVQAETAYFIVNNIESALEADQTHRFIQPQFFQEKHQGETRIRAAPYMFCVQSSTVYLTALVASIVQMIIIGACTSMYICTRNGKCCASLWLSMETAEKLMPNRM